MSLILIWVFNSTTLFAKIEKLEITNSKYRSFTFSEVCHLQGFRHVPIIEIDDINQLDCMGSKVWVTKFCQQNGKSNNFLRGYIDRQAQKVICQSGDRVALHYSCRVNDKFCQNSKSGCMKMKKVFARDLKIAKDSLVELSINGDKQDLHCHFVRSDQLQFSEIPQGLF